MPLYDYICDNGHIVEVMHGVNDSGPAKCERCGAEMRKLLSTPAIVFKGSGWAKKDRSSKPAPRDKPATDTEAKPSTATDGQSAKPDTATDTASSDSKP
ncbi:MAG TPA: FmdB family zinc ribbon protein [Candidatus Limnocylindrales bacterium]|jgi:putative FmdB family regulatory protein